MSPGERHLDPFGWACIRVSCIADMPGAYDDVLVIEMDGAAPIRVPLKVNVVGTPLDI